MIRLTSDATGLFRKKKINIGPGCHSTIVMGGFFAAATTGRFNNLAEETGHGNPLNHSPHFHEGLHLLAIAHLFAKLMSGIGTSGSLRASRGRI